VAELEMDPKLKEAGWEKYAEFKIWFDKRLDAAIKKVGLLIILREGTGTGIKWVRPKLLGTVQILVTVPIPILRNFRW